MNHRIRNRLVAHGHALAPSAETLRAAGGVGATADGKSFFEWFGQDVLGLDSEEYRRAFWREAGHTGHSSGHTPRTFVNWQRERGVHPGAQVGDMVMVYLVVGGASLAFWFIRRIVRRHLGRVRRPCYYAAERVRRLALVQERRRQSRRSTTSPRPSLDAIRMLFVQVRGNSGAALRLGGLLEDLECYLDNRPRFAGEHCLGRAGGIKRHLQRHAPDLFAHYSALMRYKAIAKRFRQAAGVADPVPVDALLPSAAEGGASQTTEGKAAPMPAREKAAKEGTMLAAAREKAARILADGTGTVIALEAALALRLDPDCIPAMADPAAVCTEMTAPRILDWLRRRRSA